MRGFAALIVYMLGLGAIICFGIAGLMALQSSTKPTPSAPVAAVAPHKERVARPVKQTTQKHAQSDQKRKTARMRREEAPSISPSGLDAYGYANEPPRSHQFPFRFFGR